MPFRPSVTRSRSGEPGPFLPFQVSVPLEWTDSRAYYVLG